MYICRQPLRIAYVTETFPPELNGVSLTVERTVRFLRARGHSVELIRPRQLGEAALDAADELRTAGCAIPMYPEMRFGLALVAPLARRFERTRPDVVHLATPGPLAWAALAAARSKGIATTSDFRTNFHQYARYYRIGWLADSALSLMRRFHNLTRCTFVPTRAAQKELAAAGFHELAVIGRGVDTDRFSPAARSAALREDWQADAGPVLLTVGRLAAEKNVALALRAFERARERVPSTQMIVVGDGPSRARLEKAYPAARFVGVQRGTELAAYYASADAFLFPSLSDTFGNVVMEALASGLPVVAFDTAAAAEHVIDGASGRLVVPGDESAFIGATCDLATMPSSWPAMREAAVAAAHRARWPDLLTRFEARLESIAHAHQTPAAPVPLVA